MQWLIFRRRRRRKGVPRLGGGDDFKMFAGAMDSDGDGNGDEDGLCVRVGARGEEKEGQYDGSMAFAPTENTFAKKENFPQKKGLCKAVRSIYVYVQMLLKAQKSQPAPPPGVQETNINQSRQIRSRKGCYWSTI